MTIRFILHTPSHPGNIGAAARAMKVMGFNDLHLIAPKTFPHPQATARAAHATDVLTNCTVHPTLEHALADLNIVIACTARSRHIKRPLETPSSLAKLVHSHWSKQTIGILFGNEQHGLDNQAIQWAQYIVTIPTHNQYHSLNLAQAVQIIAYALHHQPIPNTPPPFAPIMSNHQQRAHLLDLCTKTLKKTTFFQHKNANHSLYRCNALLQKLNPNQQELKLLHAIFSHLSTALTHQSQEQETL
jgi:TrmH family RNA methyltransferase